MQKTVVVQSPVPVCLSTGRHLAPGEIATVEADARVRSHLNSGVLREVVAVVRPAAQRRREAAQSVQEEVTSQNSEDPQETA